MVRFIFCPGCGWVGKTKNLKNDNRSCDCNPNDLFCPSCLAKLGHRKFGIFHKCIIITQDENLELFDTDWFCDFKLFEKLNPKKKIKRT